MYVTPVSFTPAPAVTQAPNRVEELNDSYQDAMSDLMQRGASNDYMQTLIGNQEQFVGLLSQAEQDGGDAKAFIRNLGAEDRAVLQKVHSLGSAITDSDIDAMSDEGAANLLRMRGDGQDSNHDGLTDRGTGHTFKFPDSNTPSSVAAAWNTTMEGLSPKDRMSAEGMLLIELSTANINIDENGKVNRAEPGDIDWVNPFNSHFSYQDWAQGQLDYLEAFKDSMSTEQYETGKHFSSAFLANLQAEGAA